MNVWDVAIKSQLGKLRADADEVRLAALETGFLPVAFTLDHGAEVARLPPHYRDLFDRALAARAML
jgi:PIN domain nuclease of toxin-antitoxin system